MKLASFRKIILLLVPAALVSCHYERKTPGKGITLDVAVFEGGFGIEWHKSVARRYEKLHPEIKINLWGDPRVDEKIKPRILRRDPPDLASCTVPIWKLIVAHKLYPLDETLDSPAYGQPNITWRQSLLPGLISDTQYHGKYYSMPLNFGLWVGWYDKRMFRKHGWRAPKTWGEFTALCEKIKAAGIAPLAFQGKYPDYSWSTLLATYQRLVPFEKYYELQDIKPGAFLDPEWAHAARLIQELAVKYFEPGAMAMTHTESQLEWVNGRAAIVFCGMWLKNEMKNAIPPGFEMDCFAVPMVEGGKGDPNAVYGGGGENFFVFADAKHPKEACDFLKFMVSKECATSYILTLETLSPVKGSTDGLKLSEDLKGAVEIQNHSTRNYADHLTGLYLDFRDTDLRALLAELLENKITPAQFGKRMQAAIERVRKNPDIYKPPAMGVPSL
jgi:N-acetylglucosamine transport system substrate-binding protein